MTKKTKKLIGCCVIFTMLIILGSNLTFAQSNDESSKKMEAMQDDVSSLGNLVYSTDTYDVYVLTDKDKIDKELIKDKISVPKEKSVKRIITKIPKNISTTPKIKKSDSERSITPMGSILLGYYIKSTTNRGDLWYFPDEILHTTSGGPGGTINMTVNEEVSATVSCSVGLDAEVVTAEVGFDITASFGISDSYTKDLADGQTGIIKAWTYHHRTDYDVWNDYLIGDDTYNTTGSAYKPNGVRFRFYEL